MWIADLEYSLAFTWGIGLPSHRIEIGDRDARFSAVRAGVAEPLIEASRDGDHLVWNELPRLAELGRDEISFHARETFATALATHGFPLIRGGEALARKIEVWEAQEHRSGYQVRTPRIP